MFTTLGFFDGTKFLKPEKLNFKLASQFSITVSVFTVRRGSASCAIGCGLIDMNITYLNFKSLRAEVTRIRPLSSVHSHMNCQVPGLVEATPADPTGVTLKKLT